MSLDKDSNQPLTAARRKGSIWIFLLVQIILLFTSVTYDLDFSYFATLEFFIAILFPLILGELDKEVVDFWYYTFGILGVALLYASQLQESTTYRKAYVKNDLITGYQAGISKYENIKKQLQQNGFNTNQALIDTELSIRFLEAKRSSAMEYSNGCVGDPWETLEECQRIDKAESLSFSLSNPKSLKDKIKQYSLNDIDYALSYSRKIEIGNFFFSSKQVARLYFPLHKNSAIESLYQEVDNELEIERRRLKQAKIELKALGPGDDFSFIKVLMTSAWSYIICIALGCKLARKNIFAGGVL